MKYLIFILLFFWFIPSFIHAAPYPLQATQDATTITVTMSSVPATDQSLYELYDGTAKAQNPGPNPTLPPQKAQNGTVVWKLTGTNGKTYSFRVQKVASSNAFGGVIANQEVSTFTTITFGTAQQPPAKLVTDLTVVPSGSRSVTVSGKIDVSRYPTVNNLRVEFSFSTTKKDDGTPTDDARTVKTGSDGQAAIAQDGTYKLTISSLTPGATYYFKHILAVQGSTDPIQGEQILDTFTPEKGYVIPESVEGGLEFNKRSYHLLAPLPGLSVLLDPDVCLQKKNAKEIPEDAICDVNGLLDFIFKLLIGAAAVMLVLRLMYEGYTYVVTDIPFLKASAKSGFFSALLGLLLAVSAYIILNTLNPKLVDNTITIDTVSVGVDEESELDPGNTIAQDSGPIPSGKVAACKGTIVRVATKGGTFTACSDVAEKFKTMIDKAWTDGKKISGGGFRTREQQISLRQKHCGTSQYDIFQKPSKSCRPPTARPGFSNHESGLAFDLTCNGQTIKSRDNECFIWLQNNAKNYGFINFSKEPWHWSVNGK